ncbi:MULTISPECIES: helix-turn-helix domain-containing protein [unclassified Stenotrophomonas]|uniref:helix-turn-helix domain-containing protein n=1 Tax=unclassified Stenotrophomonas TaxID=196198 RepID=UPI0024475D72|nr:MULTISPECIES: helix-turn-helix domain-containing protein [unclassified Stenotrophomonas]MBN5158817.1 helix-turn-helix domain-containing protein [Stenotrophomonas maltophilia]MDG9843780.1 helix-turn-helix domain-containing protein [Stenotrophomonas sp. GD04054]MDH0016604.1 helix-turn-helix domain-containing protein [Stenotrophomonas sp. GD04028]MDH0577570.1 helix-turn-helix domain-containing protein [Stenotrophomonas sp. GD03997]MDH0859455.1 helix-turn-helix domain-containing protein [Stenot
MVFDRYPNGGGEMLLALALADHAHDDGTHIFPSIARLAEKTRQSERSVQYQLRRMEQSGWLVLVNAGIGGRRSGFGEGGRTRQYRINPEWMKGADIAPFAKGAKQATKGCKTTQERVQNSVEKGATAIAPEPRATKSNQEQPSHRECEREADPLALTVEQVERELAGFGSTPTAVDREQLTRFVRHRAAIRRPLSVQGWLQVRQQLLDLIAAGHDPNESLKQTMAAGLSLPVIPVAQPSAGATHASPQHGSADRTEHLEQQFYAQRRGSGHGGGAGVERGDVVDAEFAVVG